MPPQTKGYWTKEHPKPPQAAPSDWHWFKYKDEKEAMVIEVWPGRAWWPEGLWWTGNLHPRPPKPNKRNIEQE